MSVLEHFKVACAMYTFDFFKTLPQCRHCTDFNLLRDSKIIFKHQLNILKKKK